MKKIMLVFGTRPEAIKMAPVIKKLQRRKDTFEVKVCSTGQHRQMLDQVMGLFGISADFDLQVMSANQTLADVTGKVINGMDAVFKQWKPDMILVQGDTTTVMAAALAAFYHKIDVGHIEAGLRTGNRYSPWPEEMNRLLTTRLATLHFAPTALSRDNLLREGIPAESISVTGNTVIDALFDAIRIMDDQPELTARLQAGFTFLNPLKRLILITGHRRENFGDGFQQICHAIADFSQRGDVQLVYPMHMNPNVREPVNRILGHCRNVFLIEPQDYLSFLYLMRQSYLILTDSGGVQEEAPSLGKPVVVMRDTTERPEAVATGTALLTGPNREKITECVTNLLDNPSFYQSMTGARNPYGDGRAAERIEMRIRQYYQ